MDRQGAQPRGEEWRAVVGYEGSYEVSSHGRVRSLDRKVPRPDGAMITHHGRMLRQHASPDGYMTVVISLGSRPKGKQVSRLVAEAFIGPVDGMQVDHIDYVRDNNRVDNLRIVTRRENLRHSRHKASASMAARAGDLNRRNKSKPFRVVAPDGTVHEGVNLRAFCREHDLNQSAMWAVLSPTHRLKRYKGWTAPEDQK